VVKAPAIDCINLGHKLKVWIHAYDTVIISNRNSRSEMDLCSKLTPLVVGEVFIINVSDLPNETCREGHKKSLDKWQTIYFSKQNKN
jgi:hypothetical protein